MAMIIHMTVNGKTQGLISEGCSPMTGRENTVHVMNMEQLVEIPRNDQDGRAQGHRIHRPVKAIAAIGRHSPMLTTALTTNELLDVTFHFYRYNPDGDGKEEQFFTVLLEGANLTKYRSELPFTLDEDTARFPPLEHLEFAFRKITTTYERDGIQFTDDWNEPVV